MGQCVHSVLFIVKDDVCCILHSLDDFELLVPLVVTFALFSNIGNEDKLGVEVSALPFSCVWRIFSVPYFFAAIF